MSESQEILQYETMLKRINKFMSLSGTYFDDRDVNRTPYQRFKYRWYYCFNILWIISHLVGELGWLWCNHKTAGIEKLTYIIPCVTLCALGCTKSYLFIKNGDIVIDLIKSIKRLQKITAPAACNNVEIKKKVKKRIRRMVLVTNITFFLYTTGLLLFGLNAIILTWLLYRKSGELVMQLPFLSIYPFDETDIRYWPWAYFHQMWAGVIAISTVNGSDTFFSVTCSFLQIQFDILNYDIERIVPEPIASPKSDEDFECNFDKIITRQVELIRCVDLMERIYSKSNLFNVIVSPICLCVSAFNITTLDEIVWRLLFVQFLFVWTLQIFYTCYYSDIITRSSIDVGSAVYNSRWYMTKAKDMKKLLFVLTRSQKPCKLTAMGYSDLNLAVFNRIMSAAWSYFALLQTIYNK